MFNLATTLGTRVGLVMVLVCITLPIVVVLRSNQLLKEQEEDDAAAQSSLVKVAALQIHLAAETQKNRLASLTQWLHQQTLGSTHFTTVPQAQAFINGSFWSRAVGFLTSAKTMQAVTLLTYFNNYADAVGGRLTRTPGSSTEYFWSSWNSTTSLWVEPVSNSTNIYDWNRVPTLGFAVPFALESQWRQLMIDGENNVEVQPELNMFSSRAWLGFEAFDKPTVGGNRVLLSVSADLQSFSRLAYKQAKIQDDGWLALIDLTDNVLADFRSTATEAAETACLTNRTATTGYGIGCFPTDIAAHPVVGKYIAPYLAEIRATDFRDERTWQKSFGKVRVFAVVVPIFELPVLMASSGTVHSRSALDSILIVTICAIVLLVIAVALSIVLVKLHLVDDVHSLQEAMEDVMTLDFEASEKQRDKKSFFSEVRDLRSGFIRTAETIEVITRYIPREVVKDMLQAGSLNSREMVSKRITVIFLDISDFSKLVDNLNSDDLVELAEKYFGLATRILTQHGCTIDKYIGDIVMGFWGAPLDFVRQGYSAISAALHVLNTSKHLAMDFEAVGQALALRIGITRGQCAVGNIGSDERISYTALGDTVNLAPRLQMLNSFYKTHLIVSQEVFDHANNTQLFPEENVKARDAQQGLFAARRLGLVRVKGKAQPTPIWNVVGVAKEKAIRLGVLAEGEKRRKQPTTGNNRRSRGVSRVRRDDHSEGSTRSGKLNTSVHGGTSSYEHTLSSVASDKASLLTVGEEIHCLRSRMVEEDALIVLDRLTKAISDFESMKFEEAVAILEDVIDNGKTTLVQLGLDIPVLVKQLGYWQLLVQHTPPREAFDPCENMTTK